MSKKNKIEEELLKAIKKAEKAARKARKAAKKAQRAARQARASETSADETAKTFLKGSQAANRRWVKYSNKQAKKALKKIRMQNKVRKSKKKAA